MSRKLLFMIKRAISSIGWRGCRLDLTQPPSKFQDSKDITLKDISISYDELALRKFLSNVFSQIQSDSPMKYSVDLNWIVKCSKN